MNGPGALFIISGLLGVISAEKYDYCTSRYCFVLVTDASDFSTARTRCHKELYFAKLLDTVDRELRGEATKFLLYVTSKLNTTFSELVFINMKRIRTRNLKWYLLNSDEFQGNISRKGETNYGYLRFEKSGDPSRVDRYVVAADHPTTTRPFLCDYDASFCNNVGGDRFSYLKRCLVKDDRNMQWFEARSSCVYRGSDLATIAYKADTGIPVDAKTRGLSETLNQDPTGYWVGLRYENMSWMSPSGSRREEIADGWSRSSSLLNSSDLDCACADPTANGTWSWTDCNCSAELPFICYGLAGEFSLTTPAPVEREECICNETESSNEEEKMTEKEKEEKEEERRQAEILGIILAVVISFVAAFLLAFLLFHKS